MFHITTILICVCYSLSVFLTPGLRFDDFELCSCGCLVVFSDLSPHAETQSHHVVLLAVARQTTLDVVQQSRLQPDVLSHTHTHTQTQTHARRHRHTHRHTHTYIHRHTHTHRQTQTHRQTHTHTHFQIWMDIYLRSWEIQQNNNSTFFFSIWSNDAVNSALITGINHILTYIHIEKCSEFIPWKFCPFPRNLDVFFLQIWVYTLQLFLFSFAIFSKS